MSDERVVTVQYALNPSVGQLGLLASHAGAVRFAFNYALGKVVENWRLVKEDPSVEYIGLSAYSMRKLFNREKGVVAPWWAENSKEAYNTGFANFQSAIRGFLKRGTGFPKFKSKHLGDGEGILFTTGARRLMEDRRHFVLPVIGSVRLFERANKLAYLLRHGGRITNVWVKFSRGRWFVSVTVRIVEDLWRRYHLLRTKRDKKRVVGVDVGVRSAAVFSDGTVVDDVSAYERELRKLRSLNKKLSRRRGLNKRTGEMPSNRYEDTRRKLKRVYARVSNQERDFAHKLSKQLVDGFEVIGLEDLNVAGMMRKRFLSRRIAHASFGRLRSFVEYKSELYGSRVVLVDRWFPSSKTCSDCGAVRAKLSLSERVFECFDCGFVLDRDLNAAANIRNIAAQSCGEAQNGHGEESAGLLASETILNEVSSGEQSSQPDSGIH